MTDQPRFEARPVKTNVFDRAHGGAVPSLAVVASVAGVTVVSLVWWRRRSGRRH